MALYTPSYQWWRHQTEAYWLEVMAHQTEAYCLEVLAHQNEAYWLEVLAHQTEAYWVEIMVHVLIQYWRHPSHKTEVGTGAEMREQWRHPSHQTEAYWVYWRNFFLRSAGGIHLARASCRLGHR